MTGAKHTDKRLPKGSALILTVVLSSILAIVAVLFLLASRVETLSTSSLMDERDLNLAVDTIVSKLSNTIVLDTPGVAGQEYYDYPGEEDTWLAGIEPYRDGTTYKWGQITDLTGYIRRNWGIAAGVTQKVYVDPPGQRKVIKEYSDITLDSNGDLEELLADADGDGIADSKWIDLEDVMGSRGRNIYAAIRVIDNAGTLNVNTGYQFDSNSTKILRVDGSRLHQINLSALARNPDTIAGITLKRSDMSYPADTQLEDYERGAAWKLADPCDDYTLFDISDELELRYRFLVSSPSINRIENAWEETISESFTYVADRPYDARNKQWNLNAWESRVTKPSDPNYDRRHLLSAYNLDRIIAADAADANGFGNIGMINVNFDPCDYPSNRNRQQLDQVTRNYNELYSWGTARDFYIRTVKCLDPNLPDRTRRRMKRELAQLAVNLVDLRDIDVDVTSLSLSDIDDSNDFNDVAIRDEERFVYGLEPYPVITKVAIRIDPCDPCTFPNYYGVELFNPFNFNVDNRDFSFSLAVTDFGRILDPCDPNTFVGFIPLPPIVLSPGEYMVVQNTDYFLVDPNVEPNAVIISPELVLSSGYAVTYDANGDPVVNPDIVDSRNIRIVRTVQARSDSSSTSPRYIFVDRQLIYRDWVRWDPNNPERFYGRNFDIDEARVRGAWWEVVYPRMENISGAPALGRIDSTDLLTPGPAVDISLRYRPDLDLRTIGDIARIWTVGPKSRLDDPCDADNQAVSPLFEPNSLDIGPIDPNNPYDVNNPDNTRFAGFDEYERTVPEKLLFVSIARLIGIRQDEDFIRLNLADPLYTNLFQYVTVFDPRVDGIDNDGDGNGRGNNIDDNELKVPGRINVNTAPYFAIQQLPWMTADIAGQIVDYRDKRGVYSAIDRSDRLEGELRRQLGYQVWRNYFREEPGFASIGELNLVANGLSSRSIWKYGIDAFALSNYPDLTRNSDLAADIDDFEERDMIFARISNLATVRSDIFTAYILVRLGTNGPQKRVVALLDRSSVYNSGDKVKILAVHDVSYPR